MKARVAIAVVMVSGLGSIGGGVSTRVSDQLTRFTLVEYHMGVDTRLVVYAPSEEAARAACDAAFRRIADLEQAMSDYRSTSEVMLFCGQPAKTRVKLSPDLFKVLAKSQVISEQTKGRFDCTVGPLVQLWRQARKSKVLPTPTQIESAKTKMGFNKLHLDPKTKTGWLEESGMKIDLGGIAKGYAADEALAELQKKGIRSALIEMGGDLRLGEAPPKTKGWEVEVPNAGETLFLRNCAISSSGDTEQFVELEGKRYSHVVDPFTGLGLTDRIQASVIAPNAFTSDPLSTATTLLAPSERNLFLKKYRGVRAYTKQALAPTS